MAIGAAAVAIVTVVIHDFTVKPVVLSVVWGPTGCQDSFMGVHMYIHFS